MCARVAVAVEVTHQGRGPQTAADASQWTAAVLANSGVWAQVAYDGARRSGARRRGTSYTLYAGLSVAGVRPSAVQTAYGIHRRAPPRHVCVYNIIRETRAGEGVVLGGERGSFYECANLNSITATDDYNNVVVVVAAVDPYYTGRAAEPGAG